MLFAFGIAMNVMPHIAIWVVYLTDFRGITLTQVALMEGVFWAVSMLMELPTGALSDRFGRKAAFLAATSIEGLAVLAFGFAGTFELLAVAYVLWGTGLALRSGSFEAFLYDQLDADGAPEEYPRMVGRLGGVTMGAFLVGGILGGLLAAATTLQVTVLVAFLPYVAAFFIAVRLVEPPRQLPASKPSYLGTLAGAMRVLRDVPAIRWLMLFEITIGLTMVANFMFLQPFLGQFNTPIALFGVIAAPIMLSSMSGSIIAHRIEHVLGLRTMLSASLVLAVAGVVVLAVIDHVAAFIGLAFVALMTSAVWPVAGGYINDRVTSEVRATVMSVTPLGTALLFAIAIPLLGIAADVDLAWAFGAIAAFVSLSAGGSLLLWHFADRRDPGAGAVLKDPDGDAIAAAGAGGG